MLPLVSSRGRNRLLAKLAFEGVTEAGSAAIAASNVAAKQTCSEARKKRTRTDIVSICGVLIATSDTPQMSWAQKKR